MSTLTKRSIRPIEMFKNFLTDDFRLPCLQKDIRLVQLEVACGSGITRREVFVLERADFLHQI